MKSRHSSPTSWTSYLWGSNRNSATCVTTECISWASTNSSSRRSCASHGETWVAFFTLRGSVDRNNILEFAVLVDDPLAHKPPSKPELRKWNTDRMTSIRTQSAASIAKESKKPQTLSEEALRKRKPGSQISFCSVLAQQRARCQLGEKVCVRRLRPYRTHIWGWGHLRWRTDLDGCLSVSCPCYSECHIVLSV